MAAVSTYYKGAASFGTGWADLWAAAPTGVSGTHSMKTFVGGSAPEDLAALQALGALGQTTAWPPGDAILLGDGSYAKWGGTAWAVAVPGAFPGDVLPAISGVDTTHPPATTGPTQLTANPTTAWTVGQKVTVGGNDFYWNGTAWAAGAAPAPAPATTGVTAGAPGSFTGAVPANLAALQALGPLGQTTAWTTGQSVALGTGSAHWNGSAWAAGPAA